MFQGFAFLHGLSVRPVETEMGAGDSPEIFETCREKEFDGCNAIEEQPDGKNFDKPIFWQIFIEKVKVIPEIEVCLSP